MVTKYDYFQKFYELLKHSPHGNVRIWEQTEAWYFEQTGKGRYSTFKSFTVAKSHFDNEEKVRLKHANRG